jgi:hypothetical protein
MLNASMERVKEIELLDAMCGTGKSYNLFKFISQNPHECYIYVTPMLSEVGSRAAEELAKFGDYGIVFEEPTGEGYTTKGGHLLDLLDARKNVICTHSLFQKLENSGRQSVGKHGYILIIDEELGMIDPLNHSILAEADKKQLIKDGFLKTEPDGKVVWVNEEWGGSDSAFAQVRKLADNGSLYSNKNGTFFNVQLPVQLIQAAKRVIVATYLFEGNVFQGFLKIKGIKHKPFTFDGMQLRDERVLKKALLDRIEFCDVPVTTEKLYRQLKIPVDDLRAKASSSALSHSWYGTVKRAELERMANHIRNVARHMNVKTNDLIYTLPSAILGKKGDKWIKRGPRIVKVKGYGAETCYLHKAARATNSYADKTAAIHAYNRYPHPAVKSYLQEQGAIVDDDTFALAEMIQWLFRTAIRQPDGPKVKIHIVSPRMDKLFKDWLYK